MNDGTRTPPSPPSPTAQTRQAPSSQGFASSSLTSSEASASAGAPPTHSINAVLYTAHASPSAEPRDVLSIGQQQQQQQRQRQQHPPPQVWPRGSAHSPFHGCPAPPMGGDSVESRRVRSSGSVTNDAPHVQPSPQPPSGSGHSSISSTSHRYHHRHHELSNGEERRLPRILSSIALSTPIASYSTASSPSTFTAPSSNSVHSTRTITAQSITSGYGLAEQSPAANIGAKQLPQPMSTTFNTALGYSLSSQSYGISSNHSAVSPKGPPRAEATPTAGAATTLTITTTTTTTKTTTTTTAGDSNSNHNVDRAATTHDTTIGYLNTTNNNNNDSASAAAAASAWMAGRSMSSHLLQLAHDGSPTLNAPPSALSGEALTRTTTTTAANTTMDTAGLTDVVERVTVVPATDRDRSTAGPQRQLSSPASSSPLHGGRRRSITAGSSSTGDPSAGAADTSVVRPLSSSSCATTFTTATASDRSSALANAIGSMEDLPSPFATSIPQPQPQPSSQPPRRQASSDGDLRRIARAASENTKVVGSAPHRHDYRPDVQPPQRQQQQPLHRNTEDHCQRSTWHGETQTSGAAAVARQQKDDVEGVLEMTDAYALDLEPLPFDAFAEESDDTDGYALTRDVRVISIGVPVAPGRRQRTFAHPTTPSAVAAAASPGPVSSRNEGEGGPSVHRSSRTDVCYGTCSEKLCGGQGSSGSRTHPSTTASEAAPSLFLTTTATTTAAAATMSNLRTDPVTATPSQRTSRSPEQHSASSRRTMPPPPLENSPLLSTSPSADSSGSTATSAHAHVGNETDGLSPAQRRAHARTERGVCGLSKPEWNPLGVLSSVPVRPNTPTSSLDESVSESEEDFYAQALLQAARAMGRNKC